MHGTTMKKFSFLSRPKNHVLNGASKSPAIIFGYACIYSVWHFFLKQGEELCEKFFKSISH